MHSKRQGLGFHKRKKKLGIESRKKTLSKMVVKYFLFDSFLAGRKEERKFKFKTLFVK